MKPNLCYVISDIDTSHLVDANIRFLAKIGFPLTTIFIGGERPTLCDTLGSDGFDVRFVQCRGKRNWASAVAGTVRILGEIKPRIVHTHLFQASMIGLTAAWLKGISRRVNTRHHSVEAHLYHPHAVYYDKYVNALSDKIVAITDLVADVLIDKEKVDPEKVRVIRHGFDFSKFDSALAAGKNLKEKYDLASGYPIIGVISRHIHWKGIQYIIPAFRQLLRNYPDAKLVLANAEGSYQPEILKLLEPIDVSRYVLIPFETNILDLYNSFDVFVHTPIGENYEAFGQIYVEALAMRVPSVFTLSGIANDFIKDRYNALVVPFENAESIFRALMDILQNSLLKNDIVENGHASVESLFRIERMTGELDTLYSEMAR